MKHRDRFRQNKAAAELLRDMQEAKKGSEKRQ